MKPLFRCTVVLLLAWACEPSSKVELSGDLQVGVEARGTLKQNEPVTYHLQLDSNLFLYGYVDQLSVDVEVRLYDPEDVLISTHDSPARGPENFSYEINKTGQHRLEISPFKQESGMYSVMIEGVEPIATNREQRADQMMVAYDNEAPGGVIAVMDQGETIFAKAYGKANLTHDIDFSLNTPTNIGSVSKQFTAMAILLLEQRGHLSLEDDVRKHIPELPDLGEVITIKNLLNHTNGLREVYNLMPITGWKGEDVLLRDEVLKMLQRQKVLQSSPGDEYNYNNSAFIMLAEIVARLTDTPFPKWMRENVFDPLGMDDSYVRTDPSEIIPGSAQGYSNGDFGMVESGDLYAAYGAGGIYTTPGDLFRWLDNFQNPELGGREVMDKLTTPDLLYNGDTMSYALGIGIGKYRGQRRFSHGGADIAHRAMLIYFPEIHSGVVALGNHASFSSGGTAFGLIDLFLNEYLNENDEEEEEDPGKVVVSEEVLEKYTGKYKAESIGLIIDYELEDGDLVAYPVGQSSLKLTPSSDSTFTYEAIQATVVFYRDQEGISTGAMHTQNGQNFDMIKLPPFDPAPDDLLAYTGRYFSAELETFYTMSVRDTILIAEHRNLEEIEFTPTEEDTFSGNIFFMSEVAFQRDNQGSVSSFTVSNGRTRDILFERF